MRVTSSRIRTQFPLEIVSFLNQKIKLTLFCVFDGLWWNLSNCLESVFFFFFKSGKHSYKFWQVLMYKLIVYLASSYLSVFVFRCFHASSSSSVSMFCLIFLWFILRGKLKYSSVPLYGPVSDHRSVSPYFIIILLFLYYLKKLFFFFWNSLSCRYIVRLVKMYMQLVLGCKSVLVAQFCFCIGNWWCWYKFLKCSVYMMN